jgi:hypothetical protein
MVRLYGWRAKHQGDLAHVAQAVLCELLSTPEGATGVVAVRRG